ncbi:PIN domain-containing protein [Mycolicibacterium obuense]|uniref:PIN domain-containing protein n=1 Tax=Mycolicibacterium obuense TaxID=1807 RepID=UPI0009E5D6B3|nr:PIN domain-containing protein [Mycolicibacterium obuense]
MNAGVVILDTNIIHKAGVLDTLAYRASRRICDAVGLELGITNITLHESINMQVAAAREAINQLEKASRMLGEIVEVNTFIPDVDAIRDAWDATLREHFKIYAVDGTDAIEALRREALRIAPAKVNGQGSRDCAIWLTVLRIAKEGRVVYLVTNNSKDFGEAPDLKMDLRGEADANGVDVKYVNSLHGLLAEISDGPLDTLSSDLLDAPRVLGDAVRIQVLDYLQSLDDSVTRDEIQDATVSFADVHIVASYKVTDFTVVSVKFNFAIGSDDPQVYSVSGQAEAFVKFDNEFSAFRIADPSDLRITVDQAAVAAKNGDE